MSLPTAYGTCNCDCHIYEGVSHVAPCCSPIMGEPRGPVRLAETVAHLQRELDQATYRMGVAEYQRDEMAKALDHMDGALRAADVHNLMFAAFVWGQRREKILAALETWESQKVPQPEFGGFANPANVPSNDRYSDYPDHPLAHVSQNILNIARGVLDGAALYKDVDEEFAHPIADAVIAAIYAAGGHVYLPVGAVDPEADDEAHADDQPG
jgi:hypothetical protein